MFFIRRPSREAVDRFVRDSQGLPLSYGPIGIVNGETPCRDLDEAIVTIGHGRTDFDRARAALMAWEQFDIGWVETLPRHAPVEVGTVVAVLIQHLGFWSLNGCRVLYNVGVDGRFGFAYGTLTDHARLDDPRQRLAARGGPAGRSPEGSGREDTRPPAPGEAPPAA